MTTEDIRQLLREREEQDKIDSELALEDNVWEEGRKEAERRRARQEDLSRRLKGAAKGGDGDAKGGGGGGEADDQPNPNIEIQAGNGPKKGEEESDDVDSDDSSSSSSDGDGKMMGVVKFLWREKKFLLKWSKRKKPERQGAKEVFEDWQEEAMLVIWRDHRENVRIRDWTTTMMREKNPDFIGLEQYAKEMNWEGGIDIPVEATGTSRLEVIQPTIQQVQRNKESNPCQVCHDWMVLFKPGFECVNGKKCCDCGAKFMKGKKGKELDDVQAFWPSASMPGYWCKEVRCGIAVCDLCKRKRDLNSPPKHKRRHQGINQQQ
jgi:hypothetical protein